MTKIALTGCSGKIGAAVLHNLIKYSLIPPSFLVITTSASASAAEWQPYTSKGVQVRQMSRASQSSQVAAFSDCDRLFLVSSPAIDLDFGFPDAPGRESEHLVTIAAAQDAGVRHIYYTSLGFNSGNSLAGVMRAHNRTEEALEKLPRGVGWTSIREGLYNESWPLYLGHWDLGKDAGREEVVLAGDGRISWAAIDDLGLGTAEIIADERGKWEGRIVGLNSTTSKSLEEVAGLVGEARGKEVTVKIVGRLEHERYYKEDRGMDSGLVRWWSSTYDAVMIGECDNKDTTLETILKKHGRTPVPLEQTVKEIARSKS